MSFCLNNQFSNEIISKRKLNEKRDAIIFKLDFLEEKN